MTPSDHSSLLQGLIEIFEQFKRTFLEYERALFFHRPEDKWTGGQHMIHLTKVNKGAVQALSVSKLVLRISNGTHKGEIRDYHQLKEEYYSKMALLPPGSGAAKPGPPPSDEALALDKYDKYTEAVIKKLSSYEPEDLRKYRVPHPLYGKIPLEEFLYFVHFHVQHHLNSLEKLYIPHLKLA